MKKTDVKEKVTTATGRTETEGILGFHMLRLDAIRRDPSQPRKTFNELSLQELAASIAEQGVLQNLVVRFVPQKFTLHEPDLTHKDTWQVVDALGKVAFEGPSENLCRNWAGKDNLAPYYELVAGERRLRAATLANLDVVPCMVRDLSDQDKYVVQLTENKEREALSPLEEGESFYDAVHVRKLFTTDELIAQTGMSRSHVYGRLKLAQLPKVIKEAVASGKLNAALAELVAKVPGEKNQVKAMAEIMEHGAEWNEETQERILLPMSVRQAKKHLQQNYTLDLETAIFDVKGEHLLKGVGACTDCPQRSGNCEALFPELAKSPNVCTNPNCFDLKKGAHIQRAREQAEASGLKVLPEREVKGLFAYDGGLDPYNRLSAELSDVVPGDKKNRTYKQLLGKNVPAKVAAVSPKGEVVEFYQRELLEAALVQNGFSFAKKDEPRGHETTDEERLKFKQAAELERATRQALGMAIIAEAGKETKTEKAEHGFWCRLLDLITYVLADSGADWEQPFTRRNITRVSNGWGKVSVTVLREIVTEIFLLAGHGYDDDEGTFNTSVARMAPLWGVDVKAVTKAAKAEFEEANRLPKDGETIAVDREFLDTVVEESSSVEKLGKNKIATPFEWRGALWVQAGGVSSGNEGTISMRILRVVPAKDYTGKTTDRNGLLNRWAADEKRRGDCSGQLVMAANGVQFVCEKPQVDLVPNDVLAHGHDKDQLPGAKFEKEIAQNKKLPKAGKMSAAARAKIVARQRVRWAKVKANAKK